MPSPAREVNPDDDFEVQDVMVPVRDGVKLHTLILAPKVKRADLPILLMRTPYDASKRIKQSTTLHAALGSQFAELQGFIFAFQDIRGRHGSEGIFELNRPCRGDGNDSNTDETTDAWDTIDWLVGNVAGNNGRVGIYGTSYEGWTSLMALLEPHPALRAVIPVAPLVDAWQGDDWFHNGAFRLPYAFEYVYAMESNAQALTPFPFSEYDTYTWWLKAGSPLELGRRYLDEKRHRFWSVLVNNPSYTAHWQRSAVDRLLRASTATPVATLHVHGWFDQEDIYGAPAAYAAMQSRGVADSLNYFVAGPWFHGQNWSVGNRTGPLVWDEDTAKHWREDQLVPFLDHYLKDGPAHGLAPATVFNTGSRRWERLDAWPKPSRVRARKLYLGPQNTVSWEAPTAAQGTAQSFTSDPAKPVPYHPRPIRVTMSDKEADRSNWKIWLTGDQRFVDGRPDVLTYVSEPVDQPFTARGAVTATLYAETSGTDADWIVKLIDVFPDLDVAEPEMSGYQFMISGDILRGRYRNRPDQPEAIVANQVHQYTVRLPQVNHTFRARHRVMVQVQSTWFPLYDRNPQRFVPTIMCAKPEDYQVAMHRIHTSATYPSRIEFDVT